MRRDEPHWKMDKCLHSIYSLPCLTATLHMGPSTWAITRFKTPTWNANEKKIHRSWQITQEKSTSWRKRVVDIYVCINSIRQTRRMRDGMMINIYSIRLPPNSLESMWIVEKTKDPLTLHWQLQSLHRHSIGAIVRFGANVWTCERLVRYLSGTKTCEFHEKYIWSRQKFSPCANGMNWLWKHQRKRRRMIFVETNQKKNLVDFTWKSEK